MSLSNTTNDWLEAGTLKTIKFNIFLYGVLIVYSLYGVWILFELRQSVGLEASLATHQAMRGGITLALVVAMVGLIRRQKWGYTYALATNMVMAVLPVVGLINTLVMVENVALEIILFAHLTSLVFGFICFLCWLGLLRASVKGLFRD
jgi:hypothetical protein